VSAAAGWREESRGTHRRTDHTDENDEKFGGHLVWRAGTEPAFTRVERADG